MNTSHNRHVAGGIMKWFKLALKLAGAGLVFAGLAGTAQAQTAYLRSGATCGGATSASYTPGNTFQVSLCVDIAATTRGLCGTTIQLVAANAGESDLFRVRAQSATPTGYDASAAPAFDVSINSPSEGTDYGFTKSISSPNAPATADGILLATFTIIPNGATANSYVLGLGGISDVVTKTVGSSCFTAGFVSTPISPTITVVKASAPTAITGSAPTPIVSGTTNANFVTYTNDGSPAGTFTFTGTLPAGLTLSSGGVLGGTATTPGTYNFTVTATNATGSISKMQSVVINAAPQTITFNNPGAQPFANSPLASGASSNSGLPVTLTSTTTGVCTITPANSLNITFVTAGTCTINANAAAGTNAGTTYLAATQVQQTFTITAGVPQPPTGVTGSAGFQSATISFTAPTNTGGSAIIDYTATCTGTPNANVTGAGSPLTVTGLTNGNTYACSVTARNGTGSSAASATVMVTPVNIAPPAFTSSNMVPALTVGTAMATFNITTSGGPTPTITQTGTLPPGVAFTSVMGSGTATLTGTPTTAGSYSITLTAANGQLPNATQAITITVGKANQTITFPAQTTASRTFSATPFAISPVATTTSPLAIAYTSSTPTICSVSGTNVTAITVGTCTINANQAGDANYNAAAQQQQSVMITQATQTITFGAQVSPRGFSATAIPLNPFATASSGLSVTYTSATPAVCSVSGAAFMPITLGTCTINADQAGNANFSAAPQVQQSVQITQGTQTISFSAPGTVQLTTTTTLAAAASSGLPVSFATTTPAVCTTGGTNGATLTTVTLGVCTITATQAGNTNFAAATPVTVNIQIIPLGGIVITPSANPSSYRQPVVLDISINGTSPTGTISVSAGSLSGTQTPVCTAVRLVSARASCAIPGELLVTNPMFFTVSYSGDGTNSPGSAIHQQLVDVNAVTLTVVSTPLQVVASRPLTLKAMVVAKTISSPVTFFEAGSPLAGCNQVPVSLLPGSTEIGVATCTISSVTAGDHNYVVNYPLGATFKQIVVNIPVAASGPQDFTDMWWAGASENGWGVSITQHGLKQFIVLYVYDGSGRPIFYAMPQGTWNAQQTAFTGSLYQPTSAPFSAYDPSLFRPGGATGAEVGTATVTYTGNSTARLDFTINGVSGTKQISRMAFATDDGQPKLQVGDMWWGGFGENGWGINISQQGRVLFPVWYTYNAQGNATWFGVPGGTWNGNVYTGDIYSATSSAWLGVQYVAGSFAVTKVGTMSLTFVDQSNAIMTYTVNGVTQTKVIARQPY